MSIKVLAGNRKAFHNFEITEKFEAGIVLLGTEVKALRDAKANLSDGWVDFVNGEPIMKEVHIGHYSHGNRMNHEEKRERKLLLNKREIARLSRETEERGFTIVPLQIYFKGRYIKVEIGVARGKKLHDKRESKKKQEADRSMARAMKR